MWTIAYLSSGFDSFPDTEIADDPGEEKAEGQLPPDTAHLLDATRDL